MPSYNVHQAKSNLSKLIKQTEDGERVIIMRDREPVAELVPLPRTRKKVRLGFAAGQVRAEPGWERPLSDTELEALFGRKP